MEKSILSFLTYRELQYFLLVYLAIVGASLIYFDIGISISELHISYAQLINQMANLKIF